MAPTRNRKTGAPASLQCWLQLGMEVKWALLVRLLRLYWEVLFLLLLNWSESSLVLALVLLSLVIHPALPM